MTLSCAYSHFIALRCQDSITYAGLRGSLVDARAQGMKRQRGVAAKMFSVLAEASINLEMICQGASELTVAIVIDGEQCDAAIKAVHDGMMFDD